MTKPTFTGNYPLTSAAIVGLPSGTYKLRDVQRFAAVVAPRIVAALEAGEITTIDNKSIRQDINYFVSGAYSLAISDKYTSGGLYASLPDALQWLDFPGEARLIPSFEKKLAKLVKDFGGYKIVEDMVALTAELRELADVVAYLKSVEYKANERRATIKAVKAEEIRCSNLTDKVYLAVLPLKEQAIKEADYRTRERIANCIAKLIAAEWNLDVVAPAGDYKADNEVKYRTKNGLRAFYLHFVKKVHTNVFARNTPAIVEVDNDGIEHMVTVARRDAAEQFEIYVAKLNGKINDEVMSAALAGTSVWSESHLTVVTRNKGTQVWHTQIIVNFSKLGKIFNQFPTRLKA